MQTINDFNQTSFWNYETKSSFNDILLESRLWMLSKALLLNCIGKIFMHSFFWKQKLFWNHFCLKRTTSFPLNFHQILSFSTLMTVKMLRRLQEFLNQTQDREARSTQSARLATFFNLSTKLNYWTHAQRNLSKNIIFQCTRKYSARNRMPLVQEKNMFFFERLRWVCVQ